MSAAVRKPNWRTLAPRFGCGHWKENNTAWNGRCKTCLNAHNARDRKKKRAVKRRAENDRIRRGILPFDDSVCQMELIDRPRKPKIPLSPRTVALIESCREEYERDIRQFELFRRGSRTLTAPTTEVPT